MVILAAEHFKDTLVPFKDSLNILISLRTFQGLHEGFLEGGDKARDDRRETDEPDRISEPYTARAESRLTQKPHGHGLFTLFMRIPPLYQRLRLVRPHVRIGIALAHGAGRAEEGEQRRTARRHACAFLRSGTQPNHIQPCPHEPHDARRGLPVDGSAQRRHPRAGLAGRDRQHRNRPSALLRCRSGQPAVFATLG